MLRICLKVFAAAVVVFGCVRAAQAADGKLEVFQDLQEATARIERLKDRPREKLVDGDGYYQEERLIFHDLETGAEIWSLTQEQGTDLANIERRCAWSCDGQFISFIGNKAFLDLTSKQWNTRQWAGHNYIASADGSRRRKLWGKEGEKLRLQQDKFNNWDQKRPGVLYYAQDDALWRVTLGKTPTDNVSEAIYRFPNKNDRTIQEIGDGNLMLVEESAKGSSAAYVIDLNSDPKDPRFCLAAPLKGIIHPGSFRFRRGEPVITGGYEEKNLGKVCFKWDSKAGLVDIKQPKVEYDAKMAHLWYGPPDDRVVFSGSAGETDEFGLWLGLPGQALKYLARVNDGHPSWCGHDSDCFFYAVGVGEMSNADERYKRRLLAGNAKGELKVLCTPFDRRRGGKSNYGSIPRPNQSPDATKCWFHSSMLMPSDEFTGSYVAVYRRPYAPTALNYKDGKLSWTPHQLSYEVRGYYLYRKDAGQWKQVGGLVSGKETPLTEPGTYMVTACEWSGLESDVSSPTLTLAGSSGAVGPAVKEFDRTMPQPPAGLTVRKEEAGQFRLTWTPSTSTDVRYYNVYFSSSAKLEISQKRRILSPSPATTSVLDWTAPREGDAYYAVTAVDRQGNESAPVYGLASSGGQ